MPTKRVTYPVQVKALDDTNGVGRVEAIVSVFGNVDLVGDRVMPGAFRKSIAEWKSSGDPIPVVFSHEWGDLWSHIGVVDMIEETGKGLRAVYTLDIADNPAAAQAYKLLKRRTLKEHSFAYDVVAEHRAKDGANELTDLKIIELGPTLKGANPDTELIAVKALYDAEAAKQGAASEIKSMSGRKLWVNEGIEGTYEDTQEDICEAASALFNPAGADGVWVSVQGTFPDHAIIEVCTNAGEDEYYDVPWSYDADGETVVLGVPTPVEVTVVISAATDEMKSAKAGRRLSQATQTELKSIHDAYGKAHEMLGAFLADSTTDGKQLPEGERTEIEDIKTKTDDDREPPAKSDPDWLALRTRIEQMRATK